MTVANGKLFQTPIIDRLHKFEMNQESVEVFPTRTVYTFAEAGIRFRLTFLTPALPYKLDVMARPVTYVCYDVESSDGAEHELSVYFAATADACVDENSAKVTWSRLRKKDMDFLSIGAANQAVLQKTGDDLRIDWGYLAFAVPNEFHAETCFAGNVVAAQRFADTGHLPEEDDSSCPAPLYRVWSSVCAAIPMKAVPGTSASAWFMIGYNDLDSVEFLKRRLSGYWTLFQPDFSALLTVAKEEYAALRKECEAFDAELLADAEASAAPITQSSSPERSASRSPRTSSWRTSTAPRSSSPRRTSRTAVSRRSTSPIPPLRSICSCSRLC